MDETTTCSYCKRNLPVLWQKRMGMKLSYLEQETEITVIDIMIHPNMENEEYFCGFGCLHKWLEKKI